MMSLIPKITSIRVKVVALFMIVAIFMVVVSGAAIISYEKNNSIKKEQHRLDSIAEILEPTLTATVVFNDEISANELLAPLISDPTIFEAVVKKSNGSVFADAHTSHPDGFSHDHHNENYIIATTPLVLDGTEYGVLSIYANRSSVTKHIAVYSLFITFITAITLGTGFILAVIFSHYMIKPILNLSQLANKVTETNNYALRVKSTTSDEIGALAECFNTMLENIEERDRTLESQVIQRTTELEAANSQLQKQAYLDSLSELPNRRFLNERLGYLVAHYKQLDSVGFSLLFLDLDGFKEVNDTMGHDYGDDLLIAVGKRLRDTVRTNDLVARLGGDEFTILLTDVVDRKSIDKVAENALDVLREPFLIHNEEVALTASIGIALFPEHGTNADTILKCADLAMYEAKNHGRNCYKYFDSGMLQSLIEKREVVADLKVALEQEQFELYFQPIIDFTTGKITKVEALIRWNHPTKGLVFPDNFIPIAEEFGLINELGTWVLVNATSHLQLFKERFQADVQICINVSPEQFRGDFKWVYNWLEYAERHQIDVNLISFEITENLLMSSDEIVKSRLNQLKDWNIDIAIDDFGVGYSSLSYLQQIAVDVIKIDRSFVQNLEWDPNSQALCKAIIHMAEELSIDVIAEGIEEKQQADLLSGYGCRFGQGYYFSKPIPYKELVHSNLISLKEK